MWRYSYAIAHLICWNLFSLALSEIQFKKIFFQSVLGNISWGQVLTKHLSLVQWMRLMFQVHIEKAVIIVFIILKIYQRENKMIYIWSDTNREDLQLLCCNGFVARFVASLVFLCLQTKLPSFYDGGLYWKISDHCYRLCSKWKCSIISI